MKGTTLTFVKKIQTGTDELNNPINSDITLVVDDCLVAPIIEPIAVREQQAKDQARDQVRVHLPKTFDADVSDSDFVWDGKTFHTDSDAETFMAENTPGRWNRYFRADLVSNYATNSNFLNDSFITEDGDNFFVTENSYYYFEQEMVS